MILVEKVERSSKHWSCMECAALMWAELGSSPLYAVSLPATGTRVFLCSRHLADLRSDIDEQIGHRL